MAEGRINRRRFTRDATLAAAGVAVGLSGSQVAAQPPADTTKTRSYNQNMEYRRLGKTGLMISAVSLGGHWKQINAAIPGLFEGNKWLGVNLDDQRFKKNRREVVSACIDCGINYIDACTGPEILAYSEALRGRRDKMYLGFSYYEHEMRFAEWQTTEKLLEALDDMMARAKLQYVDLWRPTCYWKPETNHTEAHELAMVEAFEKAKKAGKVRFSGLSTHKHDWAIRMIETYPEHIQVVVVPYTAGSKKAHARVDPGPGGWQAVPEKKDPTKINIHSLIDVVKKCDVGWFGIKPFASGSVFKSGGSANPQSKKEDDERARLTLRYVLCNDTLTAAIPGMISVDQVLNAAKAVHQRRQFDLAESERFQQVVKEMWATLPEDYQWLRHWEYV